MATLDQRRIDSVLGAIRSSADATDLEDFQRRALVGASSVISCDAAAYNEIHMDGSPPVTLIDPPDITFDDANDILGQYAAQNPLITNYAATGDGSVSNEEIEAGRITPCDVLAADLRLAAGEEPLDLRTFEALITALLVFGVGIYLTAQAVGAVPNF